jgi:hypothetical protein
MFPQIIDGTEPGAIKFVRQSLVFSAARRVMSHKIGQQMFYTARYNVIHQHATFPPKLFISVRHYTAMLEQALIYAYCYKKPASKAFLSSVSRLALRKSDKNWRSY